MNMSDLRNNPVQRRAQLRLVEIRNAARRVYARDGRDRFTSGAVAVEAGCSIGTFYRYFPDRVALLDQIAPFAADQTALSIVEAAEEIVDAATTERPFTGWHYDDENAELTAAGRELAALIVPLLADLRVLTQPEPTDPEGQSNG